ncbi:hypothetical protein IWX92DRAFT_375078, partial [Phyllosticta citricarpa]
MADRPIGCAPCHISPLVLLRSACYLPLCLLWFVVGPDPSAWVNSPHILSPIHLWTVYCFAFRLASIHAAHQARRMYDRRCHPVAAAAVAYLVTGFECVCRRVVLCRPA